ncbi:phosphonate transport system permease protein [Sphingopyxis sp. OAS728]|uniref:phosphonate ABC transporter, permease protein PhnE n=1 Tax=Sphingopyxis sp. OAS728 TaxID=2663823 RepID=UPI00178AFC35|nr:phosphonate ABC transporter, permease protein PhnE [Sphingopyxis sp. OAS728]MBE1527873.1 phosphonate transport system permease protein [Sphingopyxis sp. OAS728]
MNSALSWRFPKLLNARAVALLAAALLLLWYTGQRVEIGRMLALSGEAVLAQAGIADRSQVADGLGSTLAELVPIQLSSRREVSRIEGFDPEHLPPFAHIETAETRVSELNPETLRREERMVRTAWLVEPLGYVFHVAAKMLETLEIALWGSVIAALIGLPLALLGARNVTPHPALRTGARAASAFLRAIPELIAALFLVIAFGFGPIAGVLALGLHSTGFLGKFYADDIEDADPRPRQALAAMGAGRLTIWGSAILPQVLPQHIACTLYTFDRNVRMGAVIGLVGAGGIGQELKGRFDMYEYGHVGTILIAIFLVILTLDLVASRARQAWR